MEILDTPWQEPAAPDERSTVLLVDDDLELRTAMRDFLAGAGCRVLEARNAYDGLFLAAQHGHGIRLLVTEINLLPVSGIKLAENVLRLFPQTQVLCMSACQETRPVRHWMKYLNAAFLPKPFSPFDLHEKVHAILADRYEAAPMPVPDVRPAGPGVADLIAGTGRFDGALREAASGRSVGQDYSSNSADPGFWLREF